MTPEFERPKFRRGENASKPYGRNISDDPFSQTLHKSALASGFESQIDLAKALGISPKTVNKWYRGKSVPSPAVFGDLLVLLNLNDEEREPLVESYANRFAERKENFRLEASRRMMQPSNNPFGEWIENYCEENKIALSQLSQTFGLNKQLLSKNRDSLGFGSLESIRQNAKEALGLSEEQTASLNEAIDKDIEQRKEGGHRFQSGLSGKQVVKKQKELNYRTYNGQQAAIELGITREMVRQLRQKFQWRSPVLTEDDIRVFREELGKTKSFREKQRQTRMKNHPKEVTLLQ